MEQHILDILDDAEHIVNLLKNTFVAKDELIDILMTCAIAQEHLLIVGPPGTAKSELIKKFALLCASDSSDGGDRIGYFEYLLTRFTEPNEIFGAIDIAAFREGSGEGSKLRRDTAGMLPRAEIAFLDEVFKANSAILNALLAILNERVFYNGGKRETVPLLCAMGATNTVPDQADLAALYDRFLLRFWTDNVEESLFTELFHRGWKLERDRIAEGYGLSITNIITTNDLHALHRALEGTDMSQVVQPYREVVRRIRAEGIQLSDRRVIKLLKLIAASALRHKREQANTGDFWVLRHIWSDPDQIPHLQMILDKYAEDYEGDAWRSERSLSDIEDDLHLLNARQKELRHDTDYADFLQQIESIRQQLIRHSAGTDKASDEDRAMYNKLADQVEEMIDELIQILDERM